MSLEDEESTWLLALEAALHDGCDVDTLLSITRGRTLLDEHRAQVWYQCLGGGSKISNFSEFDEVFDLPEQSIIRADCQAIVSKLGNAEEDKVSIVCDVESVVSHYCKSRHLQYSSSRQWPDLLTPLLAAKLPPNRLYDSFEEILEKYIPRESSPGSAIYHLLRLLLLYHDPQLSNYIDSLKVTPEQFAGPWVRSLFACVCSLDATTALWDAYFQERDPFFVLFLTLVILINARDQILSERSGSAVVAFISSLPSALTPTDAPDFCSLARYYAIRTPNTFRREYLSSIFGSVYLSGGSNDDSSNQVTGGLPVQQALCLPVAADELLQSTAIAQYPPEHSQIGFFVVDCRPAEQYNSGHLPNAFHLDSTLMLEAVSSFNTALQGLFIVQREAVQADTPGCGPHLCLVGGGRDEEDQLLHMVAAAMLQQHTAYVSLARGGFRAVHKLLEQDVESELAEHNRESCRVCCSDSPSQDNKEQQQTTITVPAATVSAASAVAATTNVDQQPQDNNIFNKFSSISSVFKTKSADFKERLVDYITNPTGSEVLGAAVIARHASPEDTGDLYRGAQDIFTIGEDDAASKSGSGAVERVLLAEFLKRPSTVTAFSCHQVRENGYMYPSYLVLTERGIVLVRCVEGKEKYGDIVATRSLTSIMKITSKKKHPDLITFKYGTTKADGDTVITDMDRFVIPNASRATQAVKELILQQSENTTSTSAATPQ
uniref:TBC1 domain family member 23 n=1 Tax=Hirondellea gigas TaxID=1518452 RepID=A0A2P2I4W6_9CRUS